MIRSAAPFAVGLATLMTAVPTLAADMDNPLGSDDGLRSGYSDQWDNSDENDPLTFQTGVRYWYSWGAQSFSIGPDLPALSVTDQAQSGEAFFRIDDHSTSWYVKGLAGASFLTDGSFSGFDNGDIGGGNIGYAGGDIGYSWINAGKTGPTLGPFLGYMYWNDSPNASSQTADNNYTTATTATDITWDSSTGQTSVPETSTANNVEINLLRLGVSGTAQLSSFIDLSGEAALVPYAKIHGILGSTEGGVEYWSDPPGPPGTQNISSIQSSPTTIDGWGYGAMAEGFVGFHPTDNIAIKFGGRLWYLQGKADATFSRAFIGNPGESNTASDPPDYDKGPGFSNVNYISRDQPWNLMRYGLLAEFSYQF